MSEHTIIDTNKLKTNKKIIIKGISSLQKQLIIGVGGLTAVLASGLMYKFFYPSTIKTVKSNLEIENDEIANIENDLVADSIVIAEANINPNEEEANLIENSENVSYTFEAETDVNFSILAQDPMSFSEAFSVSRSDIGTGGFFNWHGNTYSTFTKEEWESMSEEQHNNFYTEVANKTNLENAAWENESIVDDSTPTTNEVLLDEIEITEEFEAESSTIVDDIIIVKPIYGVADINEDGVYDAIVLDNNGDGFADVVVLDQDYDGTYDGFMINEDGDNDLDIFIIDQGGDGIDSDDPIENIEDVINMEDFIVLDEDDPKIEEFDFMEDLLNDDQSNTTSDDIVVDEDFDEPGL